MKDKNIVDVLDELNKGACMGMDAINCIIDKVEEKGLKEELKCQYKKYESISQKIKKLYDTYSDKKPHETSAMNKAMTWYGIEMNTLMDASTSKIAELLVKGTNMGIIEGRRLLNHKDINEEIHNIIQEYVDMQETAVEKLKPYL